MTVKFDKVNKITPHHVYAGYITSPVQEWPWPSENKEKKQTRTDVLNEQILADFYGAVDWVLSQRYDEYYEIESNTINPAQQHAFKALRVYRVKRNGHYREIRIYQRIFGGCYIEMQ